jgi:hypothetical protein
MAQHGRGLRAAWRGQLLVWLLLLLLLLLLQLLLAGRGRGCVAHGKPRDGRMLLPLPLLLLLLSLCRCCSIGGSTGRGRAQHYAAMHILFAFATLHIAPTTLTRISTFACCV